MSHFSTLGGMWLCTQWESKNEKKVKQANNPKQDFSFTEYQRSGRLLFPTWFSFGCLDLSSVDFT